MDDKIDSKRWEVAQVFMNKAFAFHKENGSFWFRIFGTGFSIVDRRKYPPLFSERNGYVKHVHIKNWSIKFLRRLR